MSENPAEVTFTEVLIECDISKDEVAKIIGETMIRLKGLDFRIIMAMLVILIRDISEHITDKQMKRMFLLSLKMNIEAMVKETLDT